MASIYDKASLVLIPSGTKTSKVYSQKPTNGDGDFTFSRSTAATRVNASGNIEKETQNLAKHSNDFSNVVWNKYTNTTYTLTTETITDPFGASASIYKVSLTGNGYVTLRQEFSGDVRYMTASVYIKKSTSGLNVELDQSDGDVTSSASNTDWQRLSSSHASGYGFSFIDITITGVSGDYIYVSSAQMELGGAARDYIETTTTAIYGGITDNVPRLDYTDSSCPALLLEPLRRNLFNYSELLGGNGSGWIVVNGLTNELNSIISPEGVQNATKLIRPANSNAAWMRYVPSVTQGQKHTISVFAKAGNEPVFNITYYDVVDGDRFFNFNLSTETITGNGLSHSTYVDSDMIDYGNGWYRCYVVITAGWSSPQIQLAVGSNRGAQASEYLYIYGAQIEDDGTGGGTSYPTSYIPTYGSSVSRVADATRLNNSSALPTAYPFTLYAEMDVKAIGDEWGISFLDVSANNKYYVIGVNSSKKYSILSRNNTASSVQSTANATKGTHKICGLFTATTLKLFVDGVLIGSSNNAQSLVSSANDLLLGQLRVVSDTSIRNTIQQALVFNQELSNQEAIDLTTI